MTVARFRPGADPRERPLRGGLAQAAAFAAASLTIEYRVFTYLEELETVSAEHSFRCDSTTPIEDSEKD